MPFLSWIIPPCSFFFHHIMSNTSKVWGRKLKKRAQTHCLSVRPLEFVLNVCCPTFYGSRTWFPWDVLPEFCSAQFQHVAEMTCYHHLSLPSRLVFGSIFHSLPSWILGRSSSYAGNQVFFLCVSTKTREKLMSSWNLKCQENGLPEYCLFFSGLQNSPEYQERVLMFI